jgi:hypothetical protein
LLDNSSANICIDDKQITHNIFNPADFISFSNVFIHWKIFLHKNIEEITPQYVHYNLDPLINKKSEIIHAELVKLDLSDTTRCLHILKFLSLIPLNLSNSNLLSIGAASGNKELYATQNTPSLDYKLSPHSGQLLLNFNMKYTHPKHSVLIDSDIFWGEIYKQYNMKYSPFLSAYNNDIYEALEIVARSINDQSIRKRNLITIWRLESELLPDIPSLFSLLKKVIENNTNLIITIGAGNNDDEFNLRKEKLTSIFNYLSDTGMRPIRIILSRDRLIPEYGSLRFASYEILYCSINPDKLS